MSTNEKRNPVTDALPDLTRDAEAAPFEHSAPEPAAKQPHPAYPDRWADGTLRPENRAGEVHGADALARRPESTWPPEWRLAKAATVDRMVVDLGGAESLSSLELEIVERLGQLALMADLYEQDFAKRGMWTSRGRTRTTVGVYLSIIDRIDRLSQRLGLKRRPREVGPTIDDRLRLIAERRNK